MILSCNSCEKKFVVPDSAITATGRLVQCSSCGNKWTQFPIGKKVKAKEKISKIESVPKKVSVPAKKTKRKVVKKTGPNLYSPEYLAKKHGIKIDSKPVLQNKTIKSKTKASFGFYSFIIISAVIAIFILRLLYFTQDIIIEKLPVLEIYIDYLFESIRNIKDIIHNFFSNY
tara:strand:- start:361 stop:876 length:516 start_codon:yes stop_codon:yes gene_type:complete